MIAGVTAVAVLALAMVYAMVQWSLGLLQARLPDEGEPLLHRGLGERLLAPFLLDDDRRSAAGDRTLRRRGRSGSAGGQAPLRRRHALRSHPPCSGASRGRSAPPGHFRFRLAGRARNMGGCGRNCRMRRAETLLQEALTLPDDERAEIAGALLESLEPALEADVEAEWRQEIAARVAALEAGEVMTTPWEEIRDRLLARLSERRQSCRP
jgi:putative addiction module component (TIGR02574 family)